MTVRIQSRVSSREFLANFSAHARRLKDSGQAELIETDDATDVVALSAETFVRLLNNFALESSTADLRNALKEMESGDHLDANRAMTQLRREFSIGQPT